MLEYISVNKNYVSPLICGAIKESVEESDYYEQGTMKYDDDGKLINVVNHESRFVKCGTKFKPLFGEMINSIIQSIVEVHIEPKYHCNVHYWEQPQLLDYPLGGHYRTHADGEHWEDGKWVKVIDRDLTLLLYLDSDFEGGQIVFDNYNMTIVPETGMLVTFPSNHNFQHTALPLISGARKVLVTWLCVYGSKRVTEFPPKHDYIMRGQYPAIKIESK